MIFNLEDLSFLKDKLNKTRIIMLGEPDHGAGTAFKIKTKLIQFLYYELGFKVLAFEADFYSTLKQMGNFQDCIYQFWGKSLETQELFSWINSLPHHDPMHLCGFDCRRSEIFREKQNLDIYIDKIVDIAKSSSSSEQDRPHLQGLLKEVLINEYKSKASQEEKIFVLNLLNSLSSNDLFWSQELRNLNSYVQNAWCEDLNLSKYRDEQMADNIEWLARHAFPKDKLIIWAHNFHLLKDLSQVFTEESKQDIGYLMGEILSRKFQDQIFSIGITGYGGKYSPNAYQGEYEAEKNIVYNMSDCFEGELAAQGYQKDIFLLLSKEQSARFRPSAICLNYPQEADWSRIYDGIIYIKNMDGVHKITSNTKEKSQ